MPMIFLIWQSFAHHNADCPRKSAKITAQESHRGGREASFLPFYPGVGGHPKPGTYRYSLKMGDEGVVVCSSKNKIMTAEMNELL